MTDSYIGVPPKSGFINTAKQRVTSSTNNYVDLDHAISDLSDVIVWVNSVKQDSTNLSLTNPSKITLGGTLTASDVVEIVYLGKQVATQSPDTGSVTNSMLAGSITAGKLSSTAVDNTNTNSTLITAQTEKSSLVDADKFLISDSADSNALKYVQKSNLPSGAYGFLGKTTISSSTATVEFTGISASNIRVVFQNVGTDNSSGTNIRVQLGDSSSYRSGADTYKASHQYNQLDSASGGNEQESSTSMRLVDNIGNTAGGNLGGYLDVFGFSDSSTYMWGNFALAHQRKAGGYYSKRGGCWFNMDFSADRIKFFLSSGGDFTEGEFLLYEYKEA